MIGVDIGGANLKYAGSDGRVLDRVFPLWQKPEQLSRQLAADLSEISDGGMIAVTMTGELADCFSDRVEGVAHIVDHTMMAARKVAAPDVKFYSVDGRFLTAGEAIDQVDRVAASNWHALATCVGRYITRDAILVDVGSTTTDIICIANGAILNAARTDHQRLAERSLVYIGCRRTPVCGLVQELEYRDTRIPVMREVFATIDDARLILNRQAEDASDVYTADGRARTIAAAMGRMARMIGLDRRELTRQDAEHLSLQVITAACQPIQDAIRTARSELINAGHPAKTLVLSGHGQDLVTPATADEIIDLRDRWGEQRSRCAPAWAIVNLL